MSPQKSANDSDKGQQTAASQVKQDPVARLFAVLRQFYDAEDGRALESLVQQNKSLHAEAHDLRTTHRTILGDVERQRADWEGERRRLQEEIDESKLNLAKFATERQNTETQLSTERGNAEDLRCQLRQRDGNIHELKEAQKRETALTTKIQSERDSATGKVEALGAKVRKLQEELRVANQESQANLEGLKAAQETLATVQSFVVPLNSLDDDRTNILREAFEDLFHSTLELFQTALHCDLSDDVLAKRNVKTYSLSLPPSNSAAAKHMRVAIGLTACGQALATNVFRDTFLTQDPEFQEYLHMLAEEDLVHHAYLRGSLAKVLPATQEHNRARGIDQAVEYVMKAIGYWSQDEQSLRSGLRCICDKASAAWGLAQQAEDRIWPEFEFKLQEDWLPLPAAQESSPSASEASPKKKKQELKSKKLVNGVSGSEPRALLTSDVAQVVWPTFLAAEPQSPGAVDTAAVDRLCYGYVLTQKQIQSAEDEKSHRTARRTRRDSAPTKKRRDSAIFLSGSALGNSFGK